MMLLSAALMIAFAPVTSYADDSKTQQKDITRIVNRYGNKDGVTSYNMGGLALTLLKAAVRAGVDPSMQDEVSVVLKAMDGVKKVVAMEYSATTSDKKEQIAADLNAFFEGMSPVIEVDESGGTMSVYAVVDADAVTVKDILLYAPARCLLVCMFGTVDAQSVISQL